MRDYILVTKLSKKKKKEDGPRNSNHLVRILYLTISKKRSDFAKCKIIGDTLFKYDSISRIEQIRIAVIKRRARFQEILIFLKKYQKS